MRIVIILQETGVQLMTDLILVLFTMLLSSAVAVKPAVMSFFCGSLAALVNVCLRESDDVPSVLAQ